MSVHNKPEEGGECLICCDDLDCSNYVEYRNSGESTWNPCIICQSCVEKLLDEAMSIYTKNLLEADCRASQLRVLAQGPPIYIEEKSIFPSPEGSHVDLLWFSGEDKEVCSKVKGCLEGEEREKWWSEYKEILSLTDEEIKERKQMGLE